MVVAVNELKFWNDAKDAVSARSSSGGRLTWVVFVDDISPIESCLGRSAVECLRRKLEESDLR